MRTDQLDREMAAKAADEALWVALHLAERAGWTDVVNRLLPVKDLTTAHRRALDADEERVPCG